MAKHRKRRHVTHHKRRVKRHHVKKHHVKRHHVKKHRVKRHVKHHVKRHTTRHHKAKKAPKAKKAKRIKKAQPVKTVGHVKTQRSSVGPPRRHGRVSTHSGRVKALVTHHSTGKIKTISSV